jgi:hypothetical protein
MSKGIGSGRDIIRTRQTRREAATDGWYLWLIAVVGLVLAVYFYTNPNIWPTRAEGFYVLIFGSAAFLAAVAGAYRIYRRPILSRLP